MKNAFCFTSIALFFSQDIWVFALLFYHVAKQLDKKGTVNFKFYDVAAWLTNNRNAHIVQYLKNLRQSNNDQLENLVS